MVVSEVRKEGGDYLKLLRLSASADIGKYTAWSYAYSEALEA
jgi:hypothetical protein